MSIPCSAAQASAAQSRSAKTSAISAPAPRGPPRPSSARRFEPAPDTDGDAPVIGAPAAPPRTAPARARRPGRPRRRRATSMPDSANARARSARRGRRDDHVIPMPPLKVARSSSSSRPPSAPSSRMTEGIRQREGSSRAPSVSGSARGTLPGSPPPVMWATPRRSWPGRSSRLERRGSPGRRSASASAAPRRASPARARARR